MPADTLSPMTWMPTTMRFVRALLSALALLLPLDAAAGPLTLQPHALPEQEDTSPLAPALILAPDCGATEEAEQRHLCEALTQRLHEQRQQRDGMGVQLQAYDPTLRTPARLFKRSQRRVIVPGSGPRAGRYLVVLDMPTVHTSAHPINTFRKLKVHYTVLQGQVFNSDADLRPLGSVMLRSQLINQIEPKALTDLMRITADRLITGLTDHRCQNHPIVYCPDSFKLQAPTSDPRQQFILKTDSATDALDE